VELGAIYLAQNDYKQAEPAILQAIKLEPGEPDAHYQLGRLYKATGRKAEAEKELAKVRELRKKADESVAEKMPAAAATEPADKNKN
jgi:Flp pilus assembly protein TadD